MHVSDYVHKVLDFNSMVVARTRDGWLVRGTGNLRELRAPLALGQPVMDEGGALAGFNRHGDSQYLHVADSEASIRFRKSASRVALSGFRQCACYAPDVCCRCRRQNS